MSQSDTPLIPIDIPIETLIGCVDILEANGQPISDKTFSLIIQEILTALLLGYQKEGVVPMYETQNIIAQRFLDIVDQMGTMSKTDKDYISDTNIESILEESRKETEEESRKELESVKVPLEPIDKSNTEQNSPEFTNFVMLENIPDNDPLKKEAKSSLQQETLCKVYTQISQELWGSDKARTLWIQVIDQQTRQNERSPEQPD
ncbi:hypothetical protein LCGC14_1208260 [marine sediment metagenome]|uniref:Uncharacterized protein n=1 Tax=marine sediment metagenome TaxID=412755 RepID=A0A0F9LEU2_9ZZZZ